jgi:CRISPR-associated protein Csd1
MSWIQKLYDTYESCSAAIGDVTDESKVPLLPICHTTRIAHIEIVIDGDGQFVRSRVVPRNEARTIIPATERSAGRASGPVAHPLSDKLQYVAGDYPLFGGSKTSHFDLYREALADWCSSKYAHPKIEAVLSYIERANVIGDLVDWGTLSIDENGKLLQKTDFRKSDDSVSIFDLLGGQEQEGAFVRWIVEVPEDMEPRVWMDRSLWDSWIDYYTNTKERKTLCYVSGEMRFAPDQHPSKIRNDGDKAKLISANDSSGFTYRGRFTDSEQAAGVGFTVTQKAHNALRWVISRQGFRRNDQAIVAWAISGHDVPQPTAGPLEILGLTEVQSDEAHSAYTAQDIGIQFRNRLAGYGRTLEVTDEVVVMGLDSATPGRAAISFYRLLTGSEYLERIKSWHESCRWLHRYRFVEVGTEAKTKKKPLPYIGAPSPRDIIEAAYGEGVDDKLRVSTMERLLPCVVDGAPLPRDIVESSVRRATNRVGLEGWQWEKALSIACALFNKSMEKESYSMALEPERTSRDYLYGRLLALADNLEQWALSSSNESRQTTAARMMNRFAERPFTTWRTIELALQPYIARLGRKSWKMQKRIDEVKSLFDTDDFVSDKRLSGEFLLGFSCQREDLRNKPEEMESIQRSEEDGDDD